MTEWWQWGVAALIALLIGLEVLNAGLTWRGWRAEDARLDAERQDREVRFQLVPDDQMAAKIRAIDDAVENLQRELHSW